MVKHAPPDVVRRNRAVLQGVLQELDLAVDPAMVRRQGSRVVQKQRRHIIKGKGKPSGWKAARVNG